MKKIRILIFLTASLVLLAPFVLLATDEASPAWNVNNPDYTKTGLPGGQIYFIIKNLMEWLLGIFGFIGIIGFVISGIMYLTAAGSDDQITKAKAAMKWSLVGVIVGLIGLVVIYAVDSALSPSSSLGIF